MYLRFFRYDGQRFDNTALISLPVMQLSENVICAFDTVILSDESFDALISLRCPRAILSLNASNDDDTAGGIFLNFGIEVNNYIKGIEVSNSEQEIIVSVSLELVCSTCEFVDGKMLTSAMLILPRWWVGHRGVDVKI